MGDLFTLKAAVAAAIRTNGNQEITGQVLQNTLTSIINTLGTGAQYMGIATPSTNPGTPDAKVFYIASANGTYSNFGGITVNNEVVILVNSSGSWVKQTTGFATIDGLNNIIEKIGILASLSTEEKSNLVAAINEVVAKLATLINNVGELANLTTEEKSNLVAAINENKDKIATLGSKVEDISIPEGTNLFNGEYIEGKAINNAGVESDQSSFKHTSLVKVSPNTSYKYVGNTNGWFGVTFYGIDQQPLGKGLCPVDTGESAWVEKVFTTPSDCYFVIANSLLAANIQILTTSITLGNIGKKIKEDSVSEATNNVKKHIIVESGTIIANNSNIQYKQNYYINYSGAEVSFEKFKYTENYIKVNGGVKYKYIGMLQSYAAIVFYDKDKNVVGSVLADGTEYEKEFVTTKDTAFIRCSSYNTDVSVTIMEDVVGDWINVEHFTELETIDTLEGFKNYLGVLSPVSSYETKVYNVADLNGYDVIVNATVFNGYAAFIFEDKYNNVIEYWTNTNNTASKTFTIPATAVKMYYPYMKSKTASVSCKLYDTKSTKELTANVADIQKSLSLINNKDAENPCDYKGLESRAFNKIAFIGNSLTEGVFDSTTGGYVDAKYSYPKYFSKITGCEFTRLGYSGQTSTQIWNNISSMDLSGHDCAIIQVCENDADGGVSSATTKSNILSMINKLKTDNNGIKIFVVNVQKLWYNNNATKWQAYIDAVAEICESNDNVYLINAATYSHLLDSPTYRYPQGHCTALGYLKCAEEYAAYISYIIAKHKSEFQWIQYIGTNRQHP